MPNIVASIRQEVLASHPEAVVVERGKNFVRHQIADDAQGNQRFVLDSAVGSLHYSDGANWQEINTDWVNSTETGYADKCDQAHFITHVDSNSGRKIYPRRGITTEYFILGRPQYWNGSQWRNLNLPARVRSGADLDWDGANTAVKIDHTGSQLKVTVTLKSVIAAAPVRWPLTLVGLTWSNFTLVAQSDGAVVTVFPQPSLTDATGVYRSIPTAYVGGAIEYNPDLSGLTYPVVIDPTVDLDVGASADDAWEQLNGSGVPPGTVNLTAENILAPGNWAWGHWGARWTSVSVPNAATITSCYIRVVGHASFATMHSDVKFQNADSGAQFTTSSGDITGRTFTSAVAWDATMTGGTTYDNSPSLVSACQTVVNRAGWSSGNSMVVVLKANTSCNATVKSYDAGASYYPKIHIEYTTVQTLTRTSTPTTVALKSTKTRTSTPTTVALYSTLTRTSTPTTVAVRGTLTRTSTPSTVAVLSTLTRTATSTVAVLRTLLRTSTPSTVSLGTRFGRPSSDISTGTWTTTPLWSKLDEA